MTVVNEWSGARTRALAMHAPAVAVLGTKPSAQRHDVLSQPSLPSHSSPGSSRLLPQPLHSPVTVLRWCPGRHVHVLLAQNMLLSHSSSTDSTPSPHLESVHTQQDQQQRERRTTSSSSISSSSLLHAQYSQ